MDERKTHGRITVGAISVVVIAIGAVRRTVNDYRPAMGVMAAVVSAMVSALIDLLDL